MTLQTSGPLSLNDIQAEFGGANPTSLNEYYAGGAYVPAGCTGTNGAVPSSGIIGLNNFYGTTKSPFNPIGGPDAGNPVILSDAGMFFASVLIQCSTNAVWTYSGSGSAIGSIPSGSTATQITFFIQTDYLPKTGSFNVSATANGVTNYWQVDLEVYGNA